MVAVDFPYFIDSYIDVQCVGSKGPNPNLVLS